MNDKPQILCVCCGQILRADFQPGFGYVADHWDITCDNLECDLWGQTTAPEEYPFPNMESYLRYGREHRAERAARKFEAVQV